MIELPSVTMLLVLDQRHLLNKDAEQTAKNMDASWREPETMARIHAFESQFYPGKQDVHIMQWVDGSIKYHEMMRIAARQADTEWVAWAVGDVLWNNVTLAGLMLAALSGLDEGNWGLSTLFGCAAKRLDYLNLPVPA